MSNHSNMRGQRSGRGERVSDIMLDPVMISTRELDQLLPEVFRRQLEKAKTPQERAEILAWIKASRKASRK